MKHLLAFLLMLIASMASATDFYVGPNGTARGGTGTQALPYSSIGAAFASGKVVGGDRLLLLDGAFGDVRIQGLKPTSPVIIQAVNPGKAVFDRIEVYASQNLTFDGISVIWGKAPALYNNLFYTAGDTSGITLEDSTIMGHATSPAFATWVAKDWADRGATGVALNGSNGKVLRNNLVGIGFGIAVNGSDHLVEANTVDGYSGDGLRGNGNRLTFRGNRVTNCVSVDGNHADGFQSFNLSKTGAVFDGITIDGNTFIEQTGSPRMTLACALQGIGLFDGMFSNLRIVNNYVEVSAPHGIAVAGVTGALIDKNTVVQAAGGHSNKPWILVGDHKDGRVSSGVVISNNVAAGGVRGRFAPGVNNTTAAAVVVTPLPPVPPALVLSSKMTLAEMCALVK